MRLIDFENPSANALYVTWGVAADTALRLAWYFGTTPPSYGRTFRRHSSCAWRKSNRGRRSRSARTRLRSSTCGPTKETLVTEIEILPDNAVVRYSVNMSDDSLVPGKNAQKIPLNGSVVSSISGSPPQIHRNLALSS